MIRSLVSEFEDSETVLNDGPWLHNDGFSGDSRWPRWIEGSYIRSFATLPDSTSFRVSDIFQQVHVRCSSERMQLGLAESCTGGMVASAITDFPGSSRYFYGGWVSYSNHAKFEWLQVSAHDLEGEGPVSRVVVSDMLRGIFENSPCTVGAAISGIAGPDGGNTKNPVGTVWIGLAHKSGKALLRRFQFSGDRAGVRTSATSATGLMILELLWLLENRIDKLAEL